MNTSTKNMPRPTRRAFTIIEVTAAAAMLAVVLATFIPTLLLVQTQRRESALHRRAMEAADNLLERVLALDWSDIQGGLPDDAVRARELLDTIPGGSWALEVMDKPDPVPAKRITVVVAYGTRARTGTVHLTAWAFDSSQNGQGS